MGPLVRVLFSRCSVFHESNQKLNDSLLSASISLRTAAGKFPRKSFTLAMTHFWLGRHQGVLDQLPTSLAYDGQFNPRLEGAYSKMRSTCFHSCRSLSNPSHPVVHISNPTSESSQEWWCHHHCAAALSHHQTDFLRIVFTALQGVAVHVTSAPRVRRIPNTLRALNMHLRVQYQEPRYTNHFGNDRAPERRV
ncbi:hypothetical protein CALVIDRAFT_283530 [Calocera viscosa TUFC12733]|uniref:Uncharacterized protein n=1 Tax=Calocera viscosa (strain TUFC12733) TaxID=1330018 RepID=A0A167R7V3_CALVF|nr:hypothetical protein CALVIDRAFT_283530 [Calocera viscosa TUFC12733]